MIVKVQRSQINIEPLQLKPPERCCLLLGLSFKNPTCRFWKGVYLNLNYLWKKPWHEFITTLHWLFLPWSLFYSPLIYCSVSRSVALAIYWSLVVMLAGLTPLNPGWPSLYLCLPQSQTHECVWWEMGDFQSQFLIKYFFFLRKNVSVSVAQIVSELLVCRQK